MQRDARILAICQLISIILHNFHCACVKLPYFYFWSKIWRHHHVPPPRFPNRCQNVSNSRTFNADIGFLIFAWIFMTSCLKWGLWGKIEEWVVWCWPPTNSFLLLEVFRSVPILVKIDQDGQMQTGFIILPKLYAITIGQIISRSSC